LVIGFGNVYRRDDGVGFAVLNALRERLGRTPLGTEDDGYDDLGHEIDTLLLHQLVPELADTISPYDLVVFVDAHVGAIPDLVHQEELAACYRPATVSHTLHPCTLLAMARDIYDRHPRGVLLSILGHDFDFGQGLSDPTAALVPQAVNRVMALAAVRE
jgi:hydrogenase maturation protease